MASSQPRRLKLLNIVADAAIFSLMVVLVYLVIVAIRLRGIGVEIAAVGQSIKANRERINNLSVIDPTDIQAVSEASTIIDTESDKIQKQLNDIKRRQKNIWRLLRI